MNELIIFAILLLYFTDIYIAGMIVCKIKKIISKRKGEKKDDYNLGWWNCWKVLRKWGNIMKYKIINKTDGEMIETDDKIILYKYIEMLKERKCDYEVIVNE